MNGMEPTDEAAVARARAGDEEGFRVLVERHSRTVFRLAWRMTGNEHDAEEVVQETFLNAYRRLDRYEARSSFGTWIYRIAVNCSLDLIRARRRRTGAESSDTLLAFPSRDPGPDRLAFSGEVGDRVEQALGELSPMERTAFMLRHLEGMSLHEIALALDRNLDATKNCVFRAVQKLRRALEPVRSTV